MAKKNIATFVGPNQGLSIAGDYAYAYSGTVASTTGNQTLLEFTTGKEFIVGKITTAGSIPNNGGGVANGDITAFTLSFNGLEIARMKTETTQEDSPTYSTYPILIPPHTALKLIVLSSGTNGSTSAIIVGRIYNA